jgi:hypothetical protein
MAVFALRGQAHRAAQRRWQLSVGERYREFEFIPLRHLYGPRPRARVELTKQRLGEVSETARRLQLVFGPEPIGKVISVNGSAL